MAIQIEVLNKTVTTKPTKNGKSYQQLELAYKNLTFQGKVEGRKIVSFGNTAAAFKELAAANTGDIYDVEVVKNEASGYNDWTSAKKSVAGSAAPARTTQSTTGASVNTSPKSTYETPEERAKKQIYIVRQSSISSAIDLLSVGSKAAPKVDEVITVAKQFEDYVFGNSTDAASDVLTPPALPEDMDDDVPL